MLLFYGFPGVAMMGRPVRVELTGDDGGPPPAVPNVSPSSYY